MTNTTATGGYLAPTDTSLEADDVLADLLCGIAAAIVGLDRNLSRPRFQIGDPPAMPGPTVDWIALGISSIAPEGARGIVRHIGDGDGHDVSAPQESVEALVSFYGPHGQSCARRLRDGLTIQPNRDAMRAAGLAYVDCGPALTLGEPINASWYRRVDMTIRFRAIVQRAYPVLNLLSAQGAFVMVRSVNGGPAEAETQNWTTGA